MGKGQILLGPWCAVSRSLDVDHVEVVDFLADWSVILFAL